MRKDVLTVKVQCDIMIRRLLKPSLYICILYQDQSTGCSWKNILFSQLYSAFVFFWTSSLSASLAYLNLTALPPNAWVILLQNFDLHEM